jgi:hypothetical protein
VSRAEVYVSVLSQLRAKLTDRIDSLPIDGLERLLDTTFPYIGRDNTHDTHTHTHDRTRTRTRLAHM